MTDFGLAFKSMSSNFVGATKCGTPGYMAPETICHAQYSEKSDIFSLGSILYEMLTAKHLFIAKSG